MCVCGVLNSPYVRTISPLHTRCSCTHPISNRHISPAVKPRSSRKHTTIVASNCGPKMLRGCPLLHSFIHCYTCSSVTFQCLHNLPHWVTQCDRHTQSLNLKLLLGMCVHITTQHWAPGVFPQQPCLHKLIPTPLHTCHPSTPNIPPCCWVRV